MTMTTFKEGDLVEHLLGIKMVVVSAAPTAPDPKSKKKEVVMQDKLVCRYFNQVTGKLHAELFLIAEVKKL